MNTKLKIEAEARLWQEYEAAIPKDLGDLLVPKSECEKAKLAKAIDELRRREAERNYSRELQIFYQIPLRPNEGVKRTMIRVRLSELKKRLAAGRIADLEGHNRSLPIDPLE